MVILRLDQPYFPVGSLVKHVRYGYRGVIVAWDPSCRAPADWYRRNQTQPTRDQPWYHVLVHGATHCTYPAQTSLERDPDPGPIVHPWLGRYFEAFDGERYHRNDEPWPGQW